MWVQCELESDVRTCPGSPTIDAAHYNISGFTTRAVWLFLNIFGSVECDRTYPTLAVYFRARL